MNLKQKNKKYKGFTLVELLIAVALFSTIAVFSSGAILSIFDANRKSQSTKTVVDNLNIAIEDMTRIVRFGTNYHCDNGSGFLSQPQNCTAGTRLAVNFKGDTVVYRFYDLGQGVGKIQKSQDGGSIYTDITSPDTKIRSLKFYVYQTSAVDSSQPYVIVVIDGYVGNRPTSQSSFIIQTMMSQRKLDI